MAKLRIVLVSAARGWYGGEEQARLLAVGLRTRGHECNVLARGGETFARIMAKEGFAVTEFPGRGLNPAALLAMRRCLLRTRPDVVHFNDSPSLTAGGLAAVGLRIPLRVAARRVDFDINWKLPYQRFCDRVLCVSHAVADVLKAAGVPPQHLRIVHDGCPPERARAGVRARGRQSLGLRDEQKLVLTVAGLRDHKGHRFLLDALPAVLRHENVICALAGDGDLGDALQQQARELGIEGQVRFLGYRHDAADLIAACDLFVLPSHKEGLCSSLIDVMLAGRPIVTTTAGGIPDLVGQRAGEDSVAWLTPPSDPHALAAAILEALASPQECAGRQERAKLRAERFFTADAMIEATLDVYGEGPKPLANRAA